MVASCFDSDRCGIAARRFSPILPPIAAALAITFSSVPYSASHLAAVFGPHLSTPGMLSTLSPVRARKSAICSGLTPNFSTTPALSVTELLIVLTSRTCASTSWAKSLSPVEISTCMPAAAACRARVPMTSSASTPGTRSSGMPSASTTAIIGSTCALRSGGVGGRLAL